MGAEALAAGRAVSLLVLERVSKSFGGVTALSDVSFDVKEGEILGLMGANGAGKTTLFALIAGNMAPTGGSIRFDGQAIQGRRADRINRLGIARTFQIVKPFAGMTVLENVTSACLYGRRQERNRARAEEHALALLEEFGLAERASSLASTLTLVGRKRLEIVRALATDPRLLLLDEVLAGLTATEASEAIEIVRKLRDVHGLTLIVIEHVMKALMRLSDRIIVLHHGAKVAEGTPEAIAKDQHVADIYFGTRLPQGEGQEGATQ